MMSKQFKAGMESSHAPIRQHEMRTKVKLNAEKNRHVRTQSDLVKALTKMDFADVAVIRLADSFLRPGL